MAGSSGTADGARGLSRPPHARFPEQVTAERTAPACTGHEDSAGCRGAGSRGMRRALVDQGADASPSLPSFARLLRNATLAGGDRLPDIPAPAKHRLHTAGPDLARLELREEVKGLLARLVPHVPDIVRLLDAEREGGQSDRPVPSCELTRAALHCEPRCIVNRRGQQARPEWTAPSCAASARPAQVGGTSMLALRPGRHALAR